MIDSLSQILLLVLPRGFLHSYDVVLDSYQWEEDFNEWSKLTGSMVYWWMNDPPFDTSFIQPSSMRFVLEARNAHAVTQHYN